MIINIYVMFELESTSAIILVSEEVTRNDEDPVR